MSDVMRGSKLKPKPDKWAALDRARSRFAASEDVPADSFTTEEYAARYGLRPTTARHQLRALVESGTLRTGQSRMPDARGRVVPTNCYWVANDTVDGLAG